MQTETHNSTKRSNSSATDRPSQPEHRPNQSARRPDPKRFKTRWDRPSRREISAGGIIYRKRDGGVEVFFIKDPYGRWTFPKGHQELGESLAQTAVREIREETGLVRLKLIAPLGRTRFRFRRQGKTIEKTVHLFLFEAPPDAREQLTGEGAIWHGAWMKAHKTFSVSGYRNLDSLLAKAMRMITERETGRGRE